MEKPKSFEVVTPCGIRRNVYNEKEVDTWLKELMEKITLCRCGHGSTVKRINDDFHQCPRCGGLIPIWED